MNAIDVVGVCSNLSDGAFARLKTKVLTNRSSFRLFNSDTNTSGNILVDLLFEQKVFSSMDRTMFAKLFSALIRSPLWEVRWLSSYCDLIIKVLDINTKTFEKAKRAEKYREYLKNKMIPGCKKAIQDSKSDLNDLDSLAQIYKIAACLLRCKLGNEMRFDLYIDRETLAELESRIKSTGSTFFGPAHKYESISYILLITWILEEMICEEDGIEEE